MPRSDVDMRQTDVEMTAKIEKFVFRFFFNCQVFFFGKIVECKFLFCEILRCSLQQIVSKR